MTKIWWGILGVLGFGLVLFVVMNFLSSRTTSSSASSTEPEYSTDSWWDWTGATSEGEATTEEGVVYSVMTYPLDVLRALYETYAT